MRERRGSSLLPSLPEDIFVEAASDDEILRDDEILPAEEFQTSRAVEVKRGPAPRWAESAAGKTSITDLRSAAGMVGQAAASAPPRAGLPEPMVGDIKVTVRHSAWALNDPRLLLALAPDSAHAAAFRVLRHRLIEQGPRAVLVTSAGPQEGKTTCAVNLAMALSEFKRARVLLVEANFRTPAIASMLGLAETVCFRDQLVHHQSNPMDPWTVTGTDWGSLELLVIDPARFTEPSSVDSRALDLALAQLTHVGYDFIILDTPPVLGSADVNLVQDLSDGVLFAIWSGRSTGRELRQAFEQLSPAKIVGVAMLNV
jgi:Mrp family chromosome partitioning ATPase